MLFAINANLRKDNAEKLRIYACKQTTWVFILSFEYYFNLLLTTYRFIGIFN